MKWLLSPQYNWHLLTRFARHWVPSTVYAAVGDGTTGCLQPCGSVSVHATWSPLTLLFSCRHHVWCLSAVIKHHAISGRYTHAEEVFLFHDGFHRTSYLIIWVNKARMDWKEEVRERAKSTRECTSLQGNMNQKLHRLQWFTFKMGFGVTLLVTPNGYIMNELQLKQVNHLLSKYMCVLPILLRLLPGSIGRHWRWGKLSFCLWPLADPALLLYMLTRIKQDTLPRVTGSKRKKK